MKKRNYSRLISLVLSLMMVGAMFSTAFAVDTVAAPAAVSGLVAHPGYNSVILTWNKGTNVEGYDIYRSTKSDSGFVHVKYVNDPNAVSYKDKGANGKNVLYYYRVVAKNRSGSSPVATAASKCVRPMYMKITFKSGTTLTSHGGKKMRQKFRKGQTVTAEAFGGGKFKFWYNGGYFYANYSRMKNCKADYIRNNSGSIKNYTTKWDRGTQYYDKVTAENFVNDSGQSSRTKYLIWVSTYTQHLYLFQGRKGNWKLIKHWEVSSGKASTPSPTGFNKRLGQRFRSRSGISYWWTFQTLNSIHGKKSSYVIGSPGSHGCVRNFNNNAKWMYNNCKKGTGVIIY